MLQDELENQKLRPFLSIRWKLFLALTCLIIIIHTAFFTGFYSFQKEVFNENTQVKRSDQIKVLDKMIGLESASLKMLIKEISSTFDNASSLSVSRLRKELASLYLNKFNTRLADSILLLDSKSNLLQQWGDKQLTNNQSSEAFLRTGQVSTGLICQVSCRLYANFSVLEKGEVIAIVSVHKEISSLLSTFNQQSDIEVGLFESFPNGDTTSWDDVLFDFTHKESNIPLLMLLPASGQSMTQGVNYSIAVFDNQYIINFDKILNSTAQTINWVFIQDISIRDNQFDGAVHSIAIWGSGSLLLSLLLLYIIISKISYQLPRILAMSQAIGLEDEVVNRVSSGERRILDDELQQYDRQLAKISHKMDLLRQAESTNAIKLQSMVRELNQTKNFIDRLLNDQKTVILVQKLGGEIIALNAAGCSLFEISDYNGLTYSEIFCSDLLEDDGLAALNYLYLGGETLVKAEAQWRDSKGDLYVLLWVHALLSVPGTIDPVILSICVDITAQRKAEDRLEWLAFNDPSLINYNKQVFLEYLPFAISRSLERHKVLALLYCEISGFPEQAGIDRLDINPLILKDLSDRMSGCLRQYDMLTQLSDDHFVIILEGLSDIADAKIVTDKIIASYLQGVDIDDNEYFLEITIGASYAPEHTESVPELLRNAEMAMYQAKRKNERFSSAVIERH